MPVTTPAVENEFTARRRPQPPETLDGDTVKWLAALPPSVRPRVLPIEFARITNTLSRRWGARHACLVYLDELLVDQRGTRRGFPMAVMLEIATLKNHFETAVHPTPQTIWDDIADRQRHG